MKIWINRIVLISIIAGFFMPFINTCTRKDRDESKTSAKVEQKATFAKPDGKNYSGIGYIISDFTIDHLPIWLLIASFLVAVGLLVNDFTKILKSNATLFVAASIGVSGLLFLLYLEELENLKYGFWISLIGYSSYIISISTTLFRKNT